MGTSVIIGLISVVWGASGLVIAIVPALAVTWAARMFRDVWWRFWAAQAALLIGLLLIVGTSHLKGFWLWVACGVIGVVKGCAILGASESFRDRMLQWLGHWPLWLHRCNGMMALFLAVLLAADVMLHG